MPTLTNFKRPGDPINAEDLAQKLASTLQTNVAVTVTPTDIQVAGDGLSETTKPSIQSVLDAYSYGTVSTSTISYADSSDMSSARHNYVVTEYAAYMADKYIYDATRNKAYVGTDMVYDAVPYFNAGSTNSSGVATFYLTDTRTSAGTALFTSIYERTVVAMPYGPNSNYQVTGWTISNDKKSLSVNVNQLGAVLGGLVQVTAAAAGVPVNLLLLGK